MYICNICRYDDVTHPPLPLILLLLYQDLVPKPPQGTKAGRNTKAGRKAAGSDKAGGANKGPQAESWRVDVGTGGRTPAAEQGSHLAQKLSGPGRMVSKRPSSSH